MILLFFAASVLSDGAAGRELPAQRPPCFVFLAKGAASSNFWGSWLFVSEKDYFSEYSRFFESKGCVVRQGQFPPDATVEECGLVLRDQVERFSRDVRQGGSGDENRIAVIAHSQGGLNVRFALKSLRLSGVSSVITVGTPHSGTPVADWVVGHRDRESWFYWILRMGGYDLQALRFLGEFQRPFLEKHATHFAAVPEVRYASARAVCKTDCHWMLRMLSWWLALPSGDGLVPGESQRFGTDLGEFDLDHISSVGVDRAQRSERLRLMEKMWSYLMGEK